MRRRSLVSSPACCRSPIRVSARHLRGTLRWETLMRRGPPENSALPMRSQTNIQIPTTKPTLPMFLPDVGGVVALWASKEISPHHVLGVVGWYLPNTARTLSHLYTNSYFTVGTDTILHKIFPKNSQHCSTSCKIQKKTWTELCIRKWPVRVLLPDNSSESFGQMRIWNLIRIVRGHVFVLE